MQDIYEDINFVLYKKDTKEQVGTIQFGVVQAEEDSNGASTLTQLRKHDYGKILWLGVDNKYQGCGYGKLLMTLAIGYWLAKDAKISAIELDDCSDNYGQETDNIYFKLGFRKVNASSPETLVVSFSSLQPTKTHNARVAASSCPDFGDILNYLSHFVDPNDAITRGNSRMSWDDLLKNYTLKKLSNGKVNNTNYLKQIIDTLKHVNVIERRKRPLIQTTQQIQRSTKKQCVEMVITRSMARKQLKAK